MRLLAGISYIVIPYLAMLLVVMFTLTLLILSLFFMKEIKTEKLLITTGWPSKAAVKSEVLDVENPSNICTDLPDYPIEVDSACGGLLNNTPIICGGLESNKCYSLDSTATAWHSLAQLPAPLFQTSCAVVEEEANHFLWITGGWPGYNTSVVVQPDGKVEEGPDLPFGANLHCVTWVDPKHGVLVVYGTGNTYFYRFDTDRWTKAPKLLHGRWAHSCATFRSQYHQDRVVVMVSGGVVEGTISNSTEIYDPSNSYGWNFLEGVGMPKALHGHNMVRTPAGDGVIVLGGINGYDGEQQFLYQMTCYQDGCIWDKMKGAQMSFPRTDFVSMLIPDSWSNCTNNTSLATID